MTTACSHRLTSTNIGLRCQHGPNLLAHKGACKDFLHSTLVVFVIHDADSRLCAEALVLWSPDLALNKTVVGN